MLLLGSGREVTMLFDPPHPRIQLADQDAVPDHGGVILGYGLTEAGQLGGQVVELAVVQTQVVPRRRRQRIGLWASQRNGAPPKLIGMPGPPREARPRSPRRSRAGAAPDPRSHA